MAMTGWRRGSKILASLPSRFGACEGDSLLQRLGGSMLSSSRGYASSMEDSTPFRLDIPVPFVGHKCDPPEQSVETSNKELVEFFKVMYGMRRLEIACDTLYKSKFIRGFCHLYDGQEAVGVGMEAALTKEDAIITGYRDHCTFLGRGGSMFEVVAELLGRKGGCSLGKGGSMHMYKRDTHFYGGHGIVGAQTALGAGLALAQKYNKSNSVSMALYGDGAANQGQLFEAMNIAMLWQLPVIFVCENNHYGMGTADWRATKQPEYYKRGDYVPGLKIDGMDVLAVKKGVSYAKEHALSKGPIILEMDTYRYHGHSMSDPGSTYRTKDEISAVRQERDPIERVRKLLLAKEIVTVADLKNFEKETKKEVDDAVSKAKESPEPDAAELFHHIHVKGYGQLSYGADRKEVAVTLP